MNIMPDTTLCLRYRLFETHDVWTGSTHVLKLLVIIQRGVFVILSLVVAVSILSYYSDSPGFDHNRCSFFIHVVPPCHSERR
jgi:hypothetical protein